jgi:hypothetical protein
VTLSICVQAFEQQPIGKPGRRHIPKPDEPAVFVSVVLCAFRSDLRNSIRTLDGNHLSELPSQLFGNLSSLENL